MSDLHWYARKSQIKKTVQEAGLWRKFIEIRTRYSVSDKLPPEQAWTRAFADVMELAENRQSVSAFTWGDGK